MSHLTTLRTKIAQKAHLLQALRDLGYQSEEGVLEVEDYSGERAAVTIRVQPKRGRYAIGFRQVGDTYECVADWDRVRGVKQEPFLQQLTQRYAYHAAQATLAEQGYAVASEETTKDGRIHLVLRRAV